MFYHYEFTEATPFIEFLNENKDKLIGQTIQRIYANGSMVDEPIVIEFERFCIVIEYRQTSNITLFVIDTASFKKDPSLQFIYKKMNALSSLSYNIYPYGVERFNYANTTITDVCIESCNYEIEINPATCETRPAGGDYFSIIRICVENGDYFELIPDDYGYTHLH